MAMTGIINSKGGVGKSTGAVNLSATAGKNGNKVLLVDLDPQGSCTKNLGIDELSIKHNFVLDDYAATRMFYEKVAPSKLIIDTGFGFDIIPAGRDLLKLEQYIPSIPNGDSLLLRVFNADEALDYDYIFFDSPGFMGHIVASIINLTGDITISNIATPGSTRGLVDLLEMIEEMNEFRESFPGLDPINIRGHFFCRAEPKTIVHREQDQEVMEVLGDAHLANFSISKTTDIGTSEKICKPFISMSPTHKVTNEFQALFEELFKEDK
jgi:chromosome partitioning protein